MRRKQKIQLALAILVILGSAWYGYRQLVPKSTGRPVPHDVVQYLPKEIQEALPEEAIATLDGVEMPAKGDVPAQTRIAAKETRSAPVESFLSGNIQSQFRGNGRDVLRLTASNRGDKPAKLHLKEGTLFESGDASLVLLRPAELEIPAGETKEMNLETAATSLRNSIGDREFTRSQAWLPTLDPLLTHLQSLPEVSVAAAQTAVLALMEDAPLDVFARFQRLHPSTPAGVDPTAFQVKTSDIVGALVLLRDSGIPESNFAIASDPQLKMEAMIDSDSHDTAAKYFEISADSEWSFWKSELLGGALSTRHYALYGIAQNYPEIALTMLPEWVRETRLQRIFRLSAVRALAMTNRPEAITILQDLLQDISVIGDTEIEKSARHAIRYLEYRAAKAADATIEEGGHPTAQTSGAAG